MSRTRNQNARRLTLAVGLSASLLFAGACRTPNNRADIAYFPPPPAPPHVVHLKSFNSLDDLVPPRVTLLEVIRGGSISPFVDTPAGVAYKNDRLYICDTGLNGVHVWNLSTGQANRIGVSGAVILRKPVDVAVDDAGNIFVADSDRGEIVGFDSNGKPLSSCKPPDGQPFKPVAVTTCAGSLGVADIATHRIALCSSNDGDGVPSFHGEVGSLPGQFYFPTGVSIDRNGNWVVSEMMNARVQVLDQSFGSLRTMGQPGNRFGDLGKPKHVDVGPDGTIFVADGEFGHVHLFNSEGQLLMLLGGPGNGPGATPMPFGVAVAENLPENLESLVPADFDAQYYLFVTNTIGGKRINLFAVGKQR